jgi:inward rectifier potassium channel
MPEPAPPRPSDALRPENIRRVGTRKSALDDLYHSMLTAPWRRFLAAVIAAYLAVNVLFAMLYYLQPGALEGGSGHAFVDAFFFSVQTMATIGYGKLTPRTHFANALVTIEALVGMLGTAMASGLMFAKFSRPTARVRFSNQCVVQRRDELPTLAFRMVNERGNQIVEAQVHVVLLSDERTREGEQIRRIRDLELTRDTSPAFTLSWLVTHPITEDSPLHGLDAEALASMRASILVAFVGLDDALNSTIHVRKLYTFDEIAFGRRFQDMLLIEGDRRELDVQRIDLTEPDPAWER